MLKVLAQALGPSTPGTHISPPCTCRSRCNPAYMSYHRATVVHPHKMPLITIRARHRSIHPIGNPFEQPP